MPSGKQSNRPVVKIRVYIESRCRFVDPLDRAAEVFAFLKMEKTSGHNAVLVYLAVKDRQLAIFGDQGIHEKVGEVFWQKQVIADSFSNFEEIILQKRLPK